MCSWLRSELSSLPIWTGTLDLHGRTLVDIGLLDHVLIRCSKAHAQCSQRRAGRTMQRRWRAQACQGVPLKATSACLPYPWRSTVCGPIDTSRSVCNVIDEGAGEATNTIKPALLRLVLVIFLTFRWIKMVGAFCCRTFTLNLTLLKPHASPGRLRKRRH